LVTLRATDPSGAFSECTATVTVVDDSAPYLFCGDDITVANDAGQCGAVVAYEAPEAMDNCDASVEITCEPASGSVFPIGETMVVCTATDDAGNAASCSFTVMVEDAEVPGISAIPDPMVLWPPNHKYVVIQRADLVLGVWDNCAGLAPEAVTVAKVTSDEPENVQGNGDGNTYDDIVIGPGCEYVALRKERQGSGNGRVYTIHLSVEDEAGNEGTATVEVHVPHSKKGTAVDDGPVYEVIGCVEPPGGEE
jgi:hypothetical protein